MRQLVGLCVFLAFALLAVAVSQVQIWLELDTLVARLGTVEPMPASPVGTEDVPDYESDSGESEVARPESANRKTLDFFESDFLKPIQLSQREHVIYDKLPEARILKRDGHKDFLRHIERSGLWPLRQEDLSKRSSKQLQRLFILYSMHVDMIGRKEYIDLEERMDEADASGNYKDVSADHTFVPAPESDVVLSRSTTGNKKRFYEFTFDDHPAIRTGYELRNNAKKRLVRELNTIMARALHTDEI